MEFYDTHILTVILFTPLVGALLLLFVPRDSVTDASRDRQPFRLAWACSFRCR